VIAESGNSWYVIDPAGNWLNGYGIRPKIDVVDTEGKEWWIWLEPLNIELSEKHWLLTNKLAIVVWWDYRNNDEIAQPALTEADLNLLLSEWLEYWNNWYTEYRIIDIGLFKEFNNITELAKYFTQT